MINTNAKKFIQFLVFLTLGVFLIWYTTASLSKDDIQKVKDLVLEANPLFVLPCIVILLLSHFVRALRWKMMMDQLGPKPGILNVFLSVLVGYFLNLVFPRLGEVAKCSMLGKYENMPIDKLIGTIVAERIIDLICLLLVITITIILQFNRLGSYANELIDKTLGKTFQSINSFLLIVATIFLLVVLLYFLFKNSKWIIFIKSFFSGIKEGILSIQKINKKGLFWGYTLLIWTFYLLSIRIGFYSLTATEGLSWTPSFSILTFGSFAMIATQGGVGAYQLAVQKTLSFYGIQEVTGLAFGWLLWLVQTLMLLFVGPFSMAMMFVTNKKKNHNPKIF